MDFKPGQLNTGSAVATISTYVVDPFGLAYGYSTANAYAQDTSGNLSTAGYNPTFDLWSSGGYGTGGKTAYPNGATGTACATYWSKNW